MQNKKFMALICAVLAPLAAFANTYDRDPRCKDRDSTFAQGECLHKQLTVLEKALEKKMTVLVERVSAWRQNTEMTKREKETVLRAIKDSHQAWKKLIDIECGQLATAQNWGGSVEQNNEWNCRIERTENRVQFVVKNRAYAYLYADR